MTAAETLQRLLLGAAVMACIVIVMSFLRAWRRTRDRLFAIFAFAFLLMGFNWAALAFAQADETQTALYLVRLVAFLLIIAAIIDKNRAGRSGPRAGS